MHVSKIFKNCQCRSHHSNLRPKHPQLCFIFNFEASFPWVHNQILAHTIYRAQPQLYHNNYNNISIDPWPVAIGSWIVGILTITNGERKVWSPFIFLLTTVGNCPIASVFCFPWLTRIQLGGWVSLIGAPSIPILMCWPLNGREWLEHFHTQLR